MSSILNPNDTAIREGIKTTGVGKKGSKSLTTEQIHEILSELKEGCVSPVEKGAFFAALTLKGFTADELLLGQAFPNINIQDPQQLAGALTSDSPSWVQNLCGQLLSGATLTLNETRKLGDYLLSEQPGLGARGLVASALRVRYETPDEYEGLWQALSATIAAPFKLPIPGKKLLIQLAEPFDGVDQSYLLTPLIAQFLQQRHFRVLHLVGRNSGPKWGVTLLDIATKLKVNFLKSNSELTDTPPTFGYFLHQADLSPSIDRWVDIRRQTIKRPFLATLEKFLNPANAGILITSAFHPPYTEKMITIAERAGFPGAIVVRNGLEGGLAFNLLRPVKIMTTVRQPNGTYHRAELEFYAKAELQHPLEVEEKITALDINENVRLLLHYQENGTTDNPHFNWRIQASCTGIARAIELVTQQLTII